MEGQKATILLLLQNHGDENFTQLAIPNTKQRQIDCIELRSSQLQNQITNDQAIHTLTSLQETHEHVVVYATPLAMVFGEHFLVFLSLLVLGFGGFDGLGEFFAGWISTGLLPGAAHRVA